MKNHGPNDARMEEKFLFRLGKKSLTIKWLTFSFTSIKNYPHRIYRMEDCTVRDRYGAVWNVDAIILKR